MKEIASKAIDTAIKNISGDLNNEDLLIIEQKLHQYVSVLIDTIKFNLERDQEDYESEVFNLFLGNFIQETIETLIAFNHRNLPVAKWNYAIYFISTHMVDIIDPAHTNYQLSLHYYYYYYSILIDYRSWDKVPLVVQTGKSQLTFLSS